MLNFWEAPTKHHHHHHHHNCWHNNTRAVRHPDERVKTLINYTNHRKQFNSLSVWQHECQTGVCPTKCATARNSIQSTSALDSKWTIYCQLAGRPRTLSGRSRLAHLVSPSIGITERRLWIPPKTRSRSFNFA